MAQPAHLITTDRGLEEALQEIEAAVLESRASGKPMGDVKDIRWRFDQTSAKMNQAIYNDQKDLIHDSTLKTIVLLIEILARS